MNNLYEMRTVQNMALFFCVLVAFSIVYNFESYAEVQVKVLCEFGDSLSLEEKVEINSIQSDDSHLKFNLRQLILPASLITIGSVGVSNKTFTRLNNSIRDKMVHIRGTHFLKVDDYIQYLPVASYLLMDFIGANCKHSFKERFVVGATSYLAMGIIVNSFKYTVREKRPGSNAYNSFPSGHTATVFMGAELIRREYGTAVSIGAYFIAGGVAFLRIYNDKHWLNDIIAGAGIGILSAEIGYWLLPFYRKLFNWDKQSASVLFPILNTDENTIGVNFISYF